MRTQKRQHNNRSPLHCFSPLSRLRHIPLVRARCGTSSPRHALLGSSIRYGSPFSVLPPPPPPLQVEDEASPGCWIIKEDRGQQGQGIKLAFNLTADAFSQTKCLAQRYITPPLLIDGRRFDLRVFVFVTSYNPLRVFIAKDGIVHLCSERYTPPTSNDDIGPLHRHITNTAVNQKIPGYSTGTREGNTGNVRGFANFNNRLGNDVDAFWRDVKKAILKTIGAVKPFVDDAALRKENYGPDKARHIKCFELYGFDFISDADCRPYVLEVNQFPSWVVAGSWFANIKTRILKDVMQFAKLLSRTPDYIRNVPPSDTQQQPTPRGFCLSPVKPRPAGESNMNNNPESDPYIPDEAALLRAEDAIVNADSAIFERLWPLNGVLSDTVTVKVEHPKKGAHIKKKPPAERVPQYQSGHVGVYPIWATTEDAEEIKEMLALPNRIFSGYAKTIPHGVTATISHGDSIVNVDHLAVLQEREKEKEKEKENGGPVCATPTPPHALSPLSPGPKGVTLTHSAPALPSSQPCLVSPVSSPADAEECISPFVRPERRRRSGGGDGVLLMYPDTVADTME